MFDQPSSTENLLHSPPTNPSKTQTPPPAEPQAANDWHRTAARPTLVELGGRRASAVAWSGLPFWLSGLAFMAIVGWGVVRYHDRPSPDAALEAPPPEDAPSASSTVASPPTLEPSEWSVALDQVMPAPALAIPAPPVDLPPPTDPAPPQATGPYKTAVRLETGDTVSSVLHDFGFARSEVAKAIAALASHIRMRRLPVGQALTLEVEAPDDPQSPPVLQALTIRPEARRQITLERGEEGTYGVKEKIFATMSKLQRAAGAVTGSLIASAASAGVSRAALAEMLRAFSWDVNFQHDIKAGDHFAVLIDRSWTEDGRPVDAGRLLWARLTTGAGRQTYSVYRFKPSSGREFFYNDKGESVVKALLRTPLNLSRVSSTFGMRRHPLLGFTRMHTGVDFAAPPGTPILAAGDGQVVEAGPNGGYGNWVKISHGGGLATGYAHMTRIARGIRRSVHVHQGQVIGFVGSTGLSTGPHLHFELHRNGKPVNPLTVARTALRARLVGKDLARFKETVARVDRARHEAELLEAQADDTDATP